MLATTAPSAISRFSGRSARRNGRGRTSPSISIFAAKSRSRSCHPISHKTPSDCDVSATKRSYLRRSIHPNIATIYAIDETQAGIIALVLERIEGETYGLSA
jgi:hypothetical protein